VRGEAEGAERIGSAFLFVGGAPDSLLKKIEGCLSKQDTSTNRNAVASAAGCNRRRLHGYTLELHRVAK